VKFGKDHTLATVLLANSDSVQGSLTAVAVALRTIFGSVTVPVEHITTISVRAGTQSNPFCLQFDGRQNYVSVPHSGNFYPTSNITVECWFKTMNSRREMGLVDLRGVAARSGGSLFIYQGRLLFNGRRVRENPQISGGYVADGLWHHGAFTWNGTTAVLWLDGAKQGTVALSDFPDSGDPIMLGMLAEASEPLDGELDEVRIADSVLYSGKFTPTLDLGVNADTIAYWKFDQGSGSVVHDQSNNGHDGTLAGTPPPKWVNRVP